MSSGQKTGPKTTRRHEGTKPTLLNASAVQLSGTGIYQELLRAFVPSCCFLVEPDRQIRDQRQVVRCHERHAIAWHRHLEHVDFAFVVDVIEMQDWEEAGIRAAPAQVLAEIDALQSLG